MNFELNDEQRALQDSVARLLKDRYAFEARRAYASSSAGSDPETWKHLAEIGVLALTLPERHGGFEGSGVDLYCVMQEFGKALLLEPFLGSSVLAATAIGASGDENAMSSVFPGIASGEVRLAWAHDETEARHDQSWIETKATLKDGRWVLSGKKINVLGASHAQLAVITARVAGNPGDRAGVGLFLVNLSDPGLRLRNYRLVDDSSGSELVLLETAATPIGKPGSEATTSRAIEATLRSGIAAVCADMVGAMHAAYSLTIEYLNTRKQFGRLIGENQALRHRAAEMLVSLEIARSMAIAAAIAVDDRGDSAKDDLSRAKLCIGRHARSLAHAAIQLHGGIGVTEEYAVGHYLRRIHVMDQLFGDSDTHAARLAETLFA